MPVSSRTACFVHIPKTGGTSVCGAARRIYAREHYLHLEGRDESERASTVRIQGRKPSPHGAFVTTHLTLGWSQEQLPDAFRFCLIREPLARVESQYLHFMRSGRVTGFEDFLASFGHTAANLQTRYLSNQRFAGGVLDADGCAPLGTQDLQDALHNLEHAIDLVGVLDHYEEFVWQLGLALQWPWYSLLQRPSNRRPRSARANRFTAEQREQVLRANTYDQLLYEKAQALVAARIAQNPNNRSAQWLARGSAVYSRVAPLVSPIARRLLRLAGRAV